MNYEDERNLQIFLCKGFKERVMCRPVEWIANETSTKQGSARTTIRRLMQKGLIQKCGDCGVFYCITEAGVKSQGDWRPL